MEKKQRNEDIGYDEDNKLMHAISGTECTGLEPSAPLSGAQEKSYNEIYDVPITKKRGEKRNPGPQ